ncbi:MAG: hypothetical protein ACPF9D_01440 [Owenweeksia sp.]
MKNALQKCIALLTLTLIITSCSQTQELAKNDGPQYRYKKVYVGNKIVYRDVDDKEAVAEEAAVAKVEKQVEPVKTRKQKEELPVTASAENQGSSGEEPFAREVSNTFTRNLKEVRNTISTGSFLTRLSKKNSSDDRIRVTDASEEDDNTMIGTYEIFAIIGFAFGVASLFGGLVLAILGVIFSILGLNSGYRLFAVIGLICAIVGFILILV